jgi:hypothetical protein
MRRMQRFYGYSLLDSTRLTACDQTLGMYVPDTRYRWSAHR